MAGFSFHEQVTLSQTVSQPLKRHASKFSALTIPSFFVHSFGAGLAASISNLTKRSMNQNEIEQSILDIVDHAHEMTRSDRQGVVSVLAGKLAAINCKITDADIKELATYLSKVITTDQIKGGEDLDEDEIYDHIEAGLHRHNARLAANQKKVWD